MYVCLLKRNNDYCRWCYTRRCHKYLRIYNTAEISIKRELDAIKIIKDMRDLKVINKNILDDCKSKFLIDHNDVNLIDMTGDHLGPQIAANQYDLSLDYIKKQQF